ncbi:Lrp/AsnC family transcriptional regulator, leucine-responsive regulatory protein [Cedecea sp. NFIX57]|nr:Lrp/AsnC family transcriptional regulator, leucine-responsive regulatory protein [Cedecea sp. NFIX57]
MKPLPGMLQKVEKMIQTIPECIEYDNITGEDCFIIRLALGSVGQLDDILNGLTEFAQCNTSIVKSMPVKRRLPPL